MSRWFRFYDDVLDDPKVQRLSPHLFKTWMNLLCLASKHNGKLPSNDDIAFCLRMSVQDAAQHVDDLILASLIDIDSNGSKSPHNWSGRQYASDSSAERMKKHRAKKRDGVSDVTRDAIESESDTDTDTESPDLPSSRVAARANEKHDQGILNNFVGRRQDGRHEKIVRRAEGLGAPVDDLTSRLNEHKPKNRSAYFTTLCVEWFQRRLPGLEEQVIRDALWGTDDQYKVVMGMMVHAP